MFHAIARLRLPLFFLLGCLPGMAAVSQPGVLVGGSIPDLLAAGAARAFAAAVEVRLARDYAAMRGAVPDPVRDPLRQRNDPRYRREYETEVRKVAERRKQLALQFLDRHAAWLGEGAGLYYRGMAYRFAGDDEAAHESFRTFRDRVPRHLLRDAALVESVDCLLDSDPDFRRLEPRLREERRLIRVRRLLKRIEGRTLPADIERRITELKTKLAANELRLAYWMLVAKIEELTFEIILEDANQATRERMMSDPALRKGLKRLADPDEVTYYQDVHRTAPLEARRLYWRARDRLQEKRRWLVGRFYRDHRPALNRGLGLLWKARALRLAGDGARALEAYAAFRAACADRPEAAQAGLEQVRVLIRERVDPAAVSRLLDEVGARVLEVDERAAVQALRVRVRAGLERQRSTDGLLGRPFPGLEGVDAEGRAIKIGPQQWSGRPTVILGFAAWSEASRETLGRLQSARAALAGFRVVGVTRSFGFGWSLDSKPGDPWAGKASGPGLSVADERGQVRQLWQTAAGGAPLLIVSDQLASWLTAYPTVIELDSVGRVLAAGSGTTAWTALMARLSGVK